jgi:PKD repeat protein
MWLPEFANWRTPPATPILAIPPAYVQNNVKTLGVYTPATVESATYKSIVYGYPSQTDSWALVYNWQLFQNEINARTGEDKTFLINTLAKLEADTPLTWEELKRAARLLTKWSGYDITQTGFSPIAGGIAEKERYQFLSMLWSNNGEYLDLMAPKTLFNSQNGYEVMQLYHDLGYVTPRAYDPLNLPDYEYGAWYSETVAMMILPTNMKYIRDAMGDNFSHLGVAPIPKGLHGTESVSATGNWMLAVSQKAQAEGRADAAWSFLTWLNTPKPAGSIPMPPQIGAVPKGDSVSIMGDFLIFNNALPSRTSDQQNGRLTVGGAPGPLITDDFWFKGFMDMGAQYGRTDKAFLKSEQAQNEIGLMFERVVLIGADPVVEVNWAATRINAILPMTGDINLDGTVDELDVPFMVIDIDATPALGPAWFRGRSDFNADSIVDALDITILSTNYGRTGDPLGGELNESLSPVVANPTALYVDPPSIIDKTKTAGTTFTVDITIDGVDDLYTFDFTLNYSTTVLTATAVTLGSFFPRESVIWKEDINDTLGSVRYLVGMPMGTQEGVSGSGTLATITFTVDALGETILDLDKTKLSTSGLNPELIPHEVYDGYFANTPPTATFTYSPSNPIVGEVVTFDASASYDPDGSIVRYDWDFGDLYTGTDKITTHTYTTIGTYFVILIVTDDDGLTDLAFQEIKVVPPSEPKADLAEWKAKPAHQRHVISKHGPINPFYALVQNLGGPSVTVKVNFTVYAGEGGALVTSFETSNYTFAEGTYLTLHMFDTSTDATPPEFDTSLHGTGEFYVEARCYYYDGTNWVGGKIKSFSFTVVP